MPAPAIHLDHVSKQYGAFRAVSDLSLSVPPGRILGFLGPNGAGKTTTIRMLTGFLRPTAGHISLLGYSLHTAAGRAYITQRLGFVPDMAGVDAATTGARLLDELAQLQGQPPVDRARIIEALELTQHDLTRPFGRLSRGTRQKINLVQGLQHRPDLLILDEPTEGLDPLTKRALFDLLREARARGATIFFSSHILAEVEALCDQVALIRRGRLVAVEALAQLRGALRRRVMLQVDGRSPDAIRTQLEALPTVQNLTYTDGRWHFTLVELPPFLKLTAALPVTDLTLAPPALEEIFMHYYAREEDGDA